MFLDININMLVWLGVQIREADISRLSFAVELAEEFYGRLLNFNYVTVFCRLVKLFSNIASLCTIFFIAITNLFHIVSSNVMWQIE